MLYTRRTREAPFGEFFVFEKSVILLYGGKGASACGRRQPYHARFLGFDSPSLHHLRASSVGMEFLIIVDGHATNQQHHPRDPKV